MITKVFCYSDDVARRKCDVKSSKNYTFLFILFLILSILSIFIFVIIFNIVVAMIIFWLLLIIAIYFEAKIILEMNDKMSALAIDENGSIYKTTVIDKGAELGLLGLSIGNILKEATDSNLAYGTSSLLGSFLMIKQMNKAIKVMSVPNNVASMINNADKLTGVITNKITRIYNIKNEKKKIVITCDYEIYKKNKVKLKKKLVIKKKYNNIEEIEKVLGIKEI